MTGRVQAGVYAVDGDDRSLSTKFCRYVGSSTVRVQDDAKISNRVHRLNDAGAVVETCIQLTEFGKVRSGAEPHQLCFILNRLQRRDEHQSARYSTQRSSRR